MSETKKMTSKQALTYAIEHGNLPDNVTEKFRAMLTALENKSKGEKKPTARQKENAELTPKVLEFLRSKGKEGATCTEVMKHFDLTSTQRAAGLVRPLQDEGTVVREVRKGWAYYVAKSEQ